jgi:hypothetical protein
MFIRALSVWVALLALAVVNGGARELWLIPWIGGPAGHAVSSLSLSAAILLLSWLTIGWIHPASPRDAFLIGLFWLALTLAFEFIAGHYAFGKPWNELLADYDILSGRIWVLVLVTTLLAPPLTAYYAKDSRGDNRTHVQQIAVAAGRGGGVHSIAHHAYPEWDREPGTGENRRRQSHAVRV